MIEPGRGLPIHISEVSRQHARHRKDEMESTLFDHPTGFLDLPLEIRRLIYQKTLLTRNASRAIKPFRASKRHSGHFVALPLLLSCRQVYFETRDFVLQENRFVHIITNYDHLAADLKVAGIPVLTSGRAARDFAHYSVKVFFIFARPVDIHHIMVGAEDLDAICLVLKVLPIFRLRWPVTIRMSILEQCVFPDMNLAAISKSLRHFRKLYGDNAGVEYEETDAKHLEWDMSREDDSHLPQNEEELHDLLVTC